MVTSNWRRDALVTFLRVCRIILPYVPTAFSTGHCLFEFDVATLNLDRPSSVAEMPSHHVYLHTIDAKIANIIVELETQYRHVDLLHQSLMATAQQTPLGTNLLRLVCWRKMAMMAMMAASRSLVSLLSPAFQPFNAAASL